MMMMMELVGKERGDVGHGTGGGGIKCIMGDVQVANKKFTER